MGIDRRQMTGYLPLRDAIDRLFAGSVISPDYFGTGTQGGFPPTNMHITDDDVVVTMAVPGAKPDDIQVSVTGDTVTASGEIRREEHGPSGQQQGQGRGQTYFEEIWHGRFQRSFTLPIQVDADKATASFENGILRLTLPKAEATKPRKIQVNQRQTIEGQGQSGQQSQGNVQTETVPVQSRSGS